MLFCSSAHKIKKLDIFCTNVLPNFLNGFKIVTEIGFNTFIGRDKLLLQKELRRKKIFSNFKILHKYFKTKYT